MSGLTAPEARAQHDHALKARRSAEQACALDFLVYGDGLPERGTFLDHHVQAVKHAERCVYGPRNACARTYDPMPYDEAEPVDARMYEGTAIGALYALAGSEDVVLELEGWELKPRSVYE